MGSDAHGSGEVQGVPVPRAPRRRSVAPATGVRAGDRRKQPARELATVRLRPRDQPGTVEAEEPRADHPLHQHVAGIHRGDSDDPDAPQTRHGVGRAVARGVDLRAMQEAGYETWWISNQQAIGEFDSPVSMYAYEAEHVEWLNHASWTAPGSYDGDLIQPLKDALHASDK